MSKIMEAKEAKRKGKLYLCPTPIGNLEDITYRTLETLKSVDLIAAEDTRVSLKLLNHFGIDKPLTSYYEHNKREKGSYLIGKLLGGTDIAVVTDAGAPGISDPGEDLVRLCVQNDIEVEALPGPCAFVTALTASGMPTGRFTFEGFLTVNKRNRIKHLESLKFETRTMIFYEAPHKLPHTLKDMYSVFGDREIVLAREITKKFEEYIRTTLSGAIERYENVSPRGEYVLILHGAKPEEAEEIRRQDLPDPSELLQKYYKDGRRGKELVRLVADELKLPKREVYDIYLKLDKGE